MHSSTKQRPVDLFFSFNAHGFLPGGNRTTENAFRDNLFSQMRNKKQMDKNSENRVFLAGETVLVQNLSKPKFGLKGDLAKVVRQIDFHSVEVQLVEGGRVFRCSSSRLSHVPDSQDTLSIYSDDVDAAPGTRPTRTASDADASDGSQPTEKCPSVDRPRRTCGPPKFYGERYFY